MTREQAAAEVKRLLSKTEPKQADLDEEVGLCRKRRHRLTPDNIIERPSPHTPGVTQRLCRACKNEGNKRYLLRRRRNTGMDRSYPGIRTFDLDCGHTVDHREPGLDLGEIGWCERCEEFRETVGRESTRDRVGNDKR